MTDAELTELADAIEQTDDEDAFVLPIPYGLPLVLRQHALHEVDKLVAELRRRGHEPRVKVWRKPDGEAHSVSV